MAGLCGTLAWETVFASGLAYAGGWLGFGCRRHGGEADVCGTELRVFVCGFGAGEAVCEDTLASAEWAGDGGYLEVCESEDFHFGSACLFVYVRVCAMCYVCSYMFVCTVCVCAT